MRDGLARQRADDPRRVLPHAETLVADPVGLHQVHHAAGSGEGDGTEQGGGADVGHAVRDLVHLDEAAAER